MDTMKILEDLQASFFRQGDKRLSEAICCYAYMSPESHHAEGQANAYFCAAREVRGIMQRLSQEEVN